MRSMGYLKRAALAVVPVRVVVCHRNALGFAISRLDLKQGVRSANRSRVLFALE